MNLLHAKILPELNLEQKRNIIFNLAQEKAQLGFQTKRVAEPKTTDFYLEFCPIRTGDSLAKVKIFYGLSYDPERYNEATDFSSWWYVLKEYGIMIFFNRDYYVSIIRFNLPFRGTINKIALNDTAEDVLRLKGEPDKQWNYGEDKAWAYNSANYQKPQLNEDDEWVRYDINLNTKRVTSIFR